MFMTPKNLVGLTRKEIQLKLQRIEDADYNSLRQSRKIVRSTLFYMSIGFYDKAPVLFSDRPITVNYQKELDAEAALVF